MFLPRTQLMRLLTVGMAGGGVFGSSLSSSQRQRLFEANAVVVKLTISEPPTSTISLKSSSTQVMMWRPSLAPGPTATL